MNHFTICDNYARGLAGVAAAAAAPTDAAAAELVRAGAARLRDARVQLYVMMY